MMPAATVSLVVPSVTSNVYAMYIMFINLFVFLLLLLLLLICFTVYLSATFIKWFYVYIAVMSVLTGDKFLNFIVETINNYLTININYVYVV